ncbi:hypothetical protein NC651_036266 [Populus alba x Populus x berolinensis]|nr:hypothetical protein NC651_036266 [Populus alba x Populus x berolinensis]
MFKKIRCQIRLESALKDLWHYHRFDCKKLAQIGATSTDPYIPWKFCAKEAVAKKVQDGNKVSVDFYGFQPCKASNPASDVENSGSDTRISLFESPSNVP